MASPYMHAIFCDDLRYEVGNKFSYMGVYSGAMFVQSLPIVLPKMCVAFWMVDGSGLQRKELIFKVFMDDQVIGQVDVAIDESKPAPSFVDDGSKGVKLFNAALMISPFEINKDCRLKARAYIDGEEIKGGTLSIRAMEQVAESSI